MELGRDLHYVPLELGGVPRLDVLRSVSLHKMTNFVDNYSLCGREEQVNLSFDIMRESSEVDMEPNQEMRGYEVGYSRHGCIRSDIRYSRKQRDIRENLMAFPKEVFQALRYRVKQRCLLTCLMANAQREQSDGNAASSRDRHYQATAPSTAVIYSIRSKLLQAIIGKDKCNRRELLQGAKKWLSIRQNALVTDNEIKFPEINHVITRTVTDEMVKKIAWTKRAYLNSVNSISNISEIIPIHRYPVKKKIRQTYLPKDYVNRGISDFEEKFKPVALGGTNTDIHPVDYITVRMTILHRLEDWESRIQTMYLTLPLGYKGGTRLEILALQTSFVENGSLIFEYTPVQDMNTRNREFITDLSNSMLANAVSSSKSYMKSWDENNNYLVALALEEEQKEKEEEMKKEKKAGWRTQSNSRSRGRSGSRARLIESKNMTAENWLNINLSQSSEYSVPLVMSGHFKLLDITTVINLSRIHRSWDMADSSKEAADHIVNLFTNISRKLYGKKIWMENNKKEVPILYVSPFCVRPLDIKQPDGSTDVNEQMSDSIRMYYSQDHLERPTSTVCSVRKNGIWHHYYTYYRGHPDEQKTAGREDKVYYETVDKDNMLVDFQSIHGTIFMCNPTTGHLYNTVCLEQLNTQHRITVVAKTFESPMGLRDYRSMRFLDDESLNETLEMFHKGVSGMPDTLKDGDDFKTDDQMASESIRTEIAYMNNNDDIELPDFDFDDTDDNWFDDNEREQESELQSDSTEETHVVQIYERMDDDDYYYNPEEDKPHDVAPLWEAKLNWMASMNLIKVRDEEVLDKEEEKGKKKSRRKKNSREYLRTVTFKLPGLNLTDNVTLIHLEEDSSVLDTLLNWIKELSITSYRKQWLYTYIRNLLRLTLQDNRKLRNEPIEDDEEGSY
jgi:hypothetical protein